MFTLTEEQRKQLLQYFWAKPYGEVATHIAMLASLTPNKPTESKDDKSKRFVLTAKVTDLSKSANPLTLQTIQ